MALIPQPGTSAWKDEAALFRALNREGKINRAYELGYTSPSSYITAMYRWGAADVPASPKSKYNKAPIIKESCLIIFDAQIPYHDAEFINKLTDLARAWDIQQGISGGDFLNMTAFSTFGQKPEDKVWSRERDVAKETMSALHTSIPKWMLIMGNHEMFLIRAVAEQFNWEDILALVGKPEGFSGTDYFWCIVNIGGAKWRISHPRNISVIHGRIPQRLCEKFHMNVASGHGHLAGMTPDYSAEYCACDVGVVCDPERLDYAMTRDSTRPTMCQGALILKEGSDGKCYPYWIDPRNTDWEALKKCYKAKKPEWVTNGS